MIKTTQATDATQSIYKLKGPAAGYRVKLRVNSVEKEPKTSPSLTLMQVTKATEKTTSSFRMSNNRRERKMNKVSEIRRQELRQNTAHAQSQI